MYVFSRTYKGLAFCRQINTSRRVYTAMSTREDKQWARLSETMSSFHEWFKQEFNTIYELADGSFTKRGMSLGLYLQTVTQLNRHLTTHHTIEEQHIFPILAQRMSQFSEQTENGHVDSHKAIHDGLDKLATLVYQFKKEPSTYSPVQLRECLDGFREVLFGHLDQEVEDLKGDNLKKYWSLEELRKIPM